MFSTVPLRPALIKYTGMHPFLSAFYFHFRHNQLSLYINLYCVLTVLAQKITYFSNQALFDRLFRVRALGVCAQKNTHVWPPHEWNV